MPFCGDDEAVSGKGVVIGQLVVRISRFVPLYTPYFRNRGEPVVFQVWTVRRYTCHLCCRDNDSCKDSVDDTIPRHFAFILR